jgi:hypothetical protein
MAFYDTKNWWQSKTVWSGLATAVLGALAFFNVNFGFTEVNAVIDAAFVLLGALGVVGRVNATQAIGPATTT